MNRSIAERLVNSRMKKRMYEATIGEEKLIKEVEQILNNRLSSYETGVKVDSIEIISETEKNIAVKAEYTVSISIPMTDSETGDIYTETDIEYREQTVIIDR